MWEAMVKRSRTPSYGRCHVLEGHQQFPFRVDLFKISCRICLGLTVGMSARRMEM